MAGRARTSPSRGPGRIGGHTGTTRNMDQTGGQMTQEDLKIRAKAIQAEAIADDLRRRAVDWDKRAAKYREELGQSLGGPAEELATALNDAVSPFYEPFDWHEATSIARALIAAGYTKDTKPSFGRTIPAEATFADRDKLVGVIWGVKVDQIGTFEVGVTSGSAERIADAIIAAGYRKAAA